MIEKDNEIEGMLVLVKGLDTAGEAQYAYAIVAFERYEAFLAAQAMGTHDLSTFGTILYYGKGTEPPTEIRTRMEEQYGVRHDFEQHVMEAAKAADV